MSHWAKLTLVLSGWFISLGTLSGTYSTWSDMNSPQFVLAALGFLGTALSALYANSPISNN